MKQHKTRYRTAILLLGWAALLVFLAPDITQGQQGEMPRGPGLAAAYPGDLGIDADGRVLFAESFEIDDLDALAAHWSSISNDGDAVLEIVDDSPEASAGNRSLRITARPPENTGGHLYRRLPREVDRVFARFYVKFSENAGYVHHFVHVGGYNPSTPYPQGGAGSRPAGHERMTFGIEPSGEGGRIPAPGLWNFYAYWPEMKISADGRYWGHSIKPSKPLVVPKGRWQCVEVMMQCNSSPDASDGELALWLDGELVLHVAPGTPREQWTGLGFVIPDQGGEPFEGFRWRTDLDLKINFFWLLHYVTDTNNRRNSVNPDRSSPVLFDDIVVATEYVGPLVEAKE